MKKLFVIFAAASLLLAPRAKAQDSSEYRVLKICESDYVLRTSDGADAGRIEYIVVDPAQSEIVSAVVTGGIVANRYVTLPFSAFRLGSSHDVVLTEIDRVRLESAPVIERSRITTSTTFDRGLVERSYSHFGMDVHRRWEGRERDRSDRNFRSTTSVDSPPRSNRDLSPNATTSEADRRRAEQESARRGETNTRDTAASQARSKDKNAATSQEEKNRMERRGQNPNADSTASRDRNAASTAKEDALTNKRDQANKENRAGKEAQANKDKEKANKENSPPERRSTTAGAKGKEDSPPERAKGDRPASETHRNADPRPEEKKNPAQPESAAKKSDKSPEAKANEEKSAKEAPGAAKKHEPESATKATEPKEKSPRANAEEPGQRRGEEKGQKQGEKNKTEDETPKRKPQP